MFRAAVASGSELGTQVTEIIQAGNLVPDELTSAVVRDRLSQADAAGGFLLDGYPRNLGQVADLDAFLGGRGEELDAVIELVVPRDESIARLSLRAAKQGRSDDTEEVIANRLAIYERETAPILDVYRAARHRRARSTASARSTRSPTGSSPPSRPVASRALPPPDVVAFRRSIYKSPAQLRSMVEPGLITAAALDAVRALIAPGVTTAELDAAASRVIGARGALSNFQMVRGYRHTICTSVNEQVVHGIPSARVLEPGDIVSIDAGAEYRGWNGDSAFTVVVPDPSRPEVVAEREQLSRITEGSLWAGIAALATARHLGEVGGAVQDYIVASGHGYGILRDYVGHGIGRKMHEAPSVFNYRVPEDGARGAARSRASRSSPWSSSATRRPSSRTTAGPCRRSTAPPAHTGNIASPCTMAASGC